jgi:hypothetical protein
VNVIHDPRIGGDGSPTGQKVAVFQGVHYAKKPVRFEV